MEYFKSKEEAIEEAFETFSELIWETSREDEDTENLFDEFRSIVWEQKYQMKVVPIQYLADSERVHTQKYCLTEGVPQKAYETPIVLMKRPSDGKIVVLDGNHKTNTLLIEDPDTEVIVVEFEFEFPDDFFTYR